jgi:hypothetical protein
MTCIVVLLRNISKISYAFLISPVRLVKSGSFETSFFFKFGLSLNMAKPEVLCNIS